MKDDKRDFRNGCGSTTDARGRVRTSNEILEEALGWFGGGRADGGYQRPLALRIDMTQREWMRLSREEDASEDGEGRGEELAWVEGLPEGEREEARLWTEYCIRRRDEDREREAEWKRRKMAALVRKAEGSMRTREYWKKVREAEAALAQTGNNGRSADWYRDALSHAYRDECTKRGRRCFKSGALSDAATAVSRWMEKRPKPGLMLRGGVGVGKTTMMRAMVRVLRDTGTPVRWVSAEEVNDAMTDGAEAFRELSGCEVLALDDLGTESLEIKDYGNSVLPVVLLVEERYSRRLTTIVTTNLTDEATAERYGERTADRLRELCNYFSFPTSMESWRGRRQ